MTKVRVFIATTEGPAEVQRITAEDPNVRSVICLDCKAVSLPISQGYDAFVRSPTGLLEAAFGHSSYRLDVARPISSGLSWQLGVLVAHALFAAGRLAEKNQAAERAIWLTGEVDRDREVLAISHLDEKLRSSSELLRKLGASGTPITLFVPKGNAGDLTSRVDDHAVDIMPVGSADEVLRHLGLPALRGAGGRAASLAISRDARDERALAWSLIGFGLVSAFLLAGGWGSHLLAPIGAVERQERGLPSSPELSVAAVELRAQEGESCAAVTFGTADPEITETALSPGALVGSRAGDRLCRLQYRITNGREAAQVWVFGARAGKETPHLHTKTLTRAQTLREAESLSIDVPLPRRFESDLFHRLAVIASPEAEERMSGRLADISGALGPSRSVEEWEALVGDLRRAGLNVIDATHVISP